MTGRKIFAGVAAVAAFTGVAVGIMGVSTAHDLASDWTDHDVVGDDRQ
jgi:hypothetical protein